MTRTRTVTLAGALLAAALASAPSSTAFAQGGAPTTPPPPSGDQRRPGPPPGGMGRRGGMFAMRRSMPSVDERVQRMSGELNLNADQTARVRTLMLAEQRTADSIRAERAVRMEAERKAMTARHDAHEKALLAILTPEQKAKREALMNQHRGYDGRGRRPGGAGAPGGAMERRGDRRGPGDDSNRSQ